MRLAITCLVFSCVLCVSGNVFAESRGLPASRIVGGSPTTEYPAVVQVDFPSVKFSGVLVSPWAVLTAAHGVAKLSAEELQEGKVLFGSVTWGDDANPDAVIDVVEVRWHRYYDVDSYELYDIALLRLAQAAPTEPLPLASVTEELRGGDRIRVVGFGQGGVDEDFGTKRYIDLRVSAVDQRTIYFSTADVGPCFGDSGGPILDETRADPVIVGLVERAGCADIASVHTRVQPYWAEFIRPTLQRWQQECPLDGRCTTVACAVEDPDCNPCAFNDSCDEACLLDLDCPVKGRFEERCVSNSDCESGQCVAQDGVGYCSLPCGPDVPAGICESRRFAMSCSNAAAYAPEDGDAATYACVYDGKVPGTEGATCGKNSDCDSGGCDPNRRVCVQECGKGESCPAAHSCQVLGGGRRYCLYRPDSDDGCSAAEGGRQRLFPLLAALLFLGVVRWRRSTVRVAER